jgi:PKD repeat protein
MFAFNISILFKTNVFMKKQFLILVVVCINFATLHAVEVNKLVNGNMESQGGWTTSYLNTPDTQYPVVQWGYTENVPTNGAGGALHVVGTTTGGNSQFCIYQKVTLTQGFVYEFDGAFKNISTDRSWCEVFIGNEPVASSDYGEGTGAAQGTLLAKYGEWAQPSSADGTFKLNSVGWKTFIPTVTGDYYFVIKMGATTWDGTTRICDVILDELKLIETRTKPVVGFTADNTLGFPPLTVAFTNSSSLADSYEWNFGDGTAVSTDVNPVHVYTAAGTYTVTLKAMNEVGETTVVKSGYIVVNEKPTLPAGEMLYGGNMENANFWMVDYLNTGSDKYPTASWNNTANMPGAGAGGCLYVNSTGGSDGIQYAIYQKVSLIDGKTYEFDGAFRDLTSNLSSFWCEVYIGSKPAGNGADYGDGQGTRIAKFDIWGTYAGDRIDGTFKLNAHNFTTYTATATEDKYLVAKMGTWWGSGYQISWDEFSLKDLSLTTAINQSKSDNYKISTATNIIKIEGAVGTVSLYTIEGRIIQSENITGTFSSKSLNAGFYVVNVNGNSTKVVLK